MPSSVDINHALWRFSELPRTRTAFLGRHCSRQLHMFPGKDVEQQRASAFGLAHAWYDFVHISNIGNYMNCTSIDDDSDLILQSITLPFNY